MDEVLQKIKENLKLSDTAEQNFKTMITSLSEFGKTFKSPPKNDSLVLESVDVVIDVLTKCLENDLNTFITKHGESAKLLVLILMALNCYDTDSYMRAIFPRFHRFLDVTESVPRASIYSKVDPLSKLPKCLLRKFNLARTYMTQEYIIKLWVRIFEDIGIIQAASLMESIKFNNNEKCNKVIKKEFVTIKLDSFDQDCRRFLNKYNEIAPECRIFSIKSRLTKINNIQLNDGQIENVWVDFQITNLSIAFTSSFSFTVDSETSEIFNIEIESYGEFAFVSDIPNQRFELLVGPINYTITNSAGERVNNCEMDNIVFEFVDKKEKHEVFEKNVFELFKKQKVPAIPECCFAAGDNDSLFSITTPKNSKIAPKFVLPGTGNSSVLASADGKVQNCDATQPSQILLSRQFKSQGVNMEVEQYLKQQEDSKKAKRSLIRKIPEKVQETPKTMDEGESSQKIFLDKKSVPDNQCDAKMLLDDRLEVPEIKLAPLNLEKAQFNEEVFETIDLISQDADEHPIVHNSNDLFSTGPTSDPAGVVNLSEQVQVDPVKKSVQKDRDLVGEFDRLRDELGQSSRRVEKPGNLKEKTSERRFQEKPRSTSQTVKNVDTIYKFDETDDDLYFRPYRSKKTQAIEPDPEIPAKRAKQTRVASRRRRTQQREIDESGSDFLKPPIPARPRKHTRTQTQNKKVEKTEENGKKSVTMVKSKKTFKRGYTDLSSLESAKENGKINAVDYTKEEVTTLKYEVEPKDELENVDGVQEPLKVKAKIIVIPKRSRKKADDVEMGEDPANFSKKTPSKNMECNEDLSEMVETTKDTEKLGHTGTSEMVEISINPRMNPVVNKAAEKTGVLLRNPGTSRKIPEQIRENPPKIVQVQANPQKALKRPILQENYDASEMAGPSGYRSPVANKKIKVTNDTDKIYRDSLAPQKATFHLNQNMSKKPARRLTVPLVNQSGWNTTLQKNQIIETSAGPYNMMFLEQNPLLQNYLESVPQNFKNDPNLETEVKPTKSAEESQEIDETVNHTYTIQKHVGNVDQSANNFQIAEKVTAIPGKLMIPKTARNANGESEDKLNDQNLELANQRLERNAEEEGKSAIDRMKEALTESFLAILKEKKEQLHTFEFDPEKFDFTDVADQMNKLAAIKRALQEAVPTYISMLKNVQDQRKKILLLQDKESSVTKDLLHKNLGNLQEMKNIAGDFYNLIDASICDGQQSLEEKKKEIWNKFINEVFDELRNNSTLFEV